MSLCDWDGESFCWADGCTNPATQSRPYALTDDGVPVVEMLCPDHATEAAR